MTTQQNLPVHIVGKLRRAVIIVGVGVALLTATALTATALPATALPATAGVATAEGASSSDPVPSFNGRVLATTYAGNTIFIGGDFTAAVIGGRRIARTRLAAVNAITGELLPWAPTADARVKAIAVSGSAVYVAGDFTTISGVKRDSLARLDASSGAVHAVKHSVSGRPYALAAYNGRLYMGGSISSVNGQSRTRLAAFKLSSGALDGSWKPKVDDQVEAITAASSRIYVGGKFQKVNSASGYGRLVALSPSSGSIVTSFKPKASYLTYGVSVSSSGVYAAQGGPGGKVSAYTTSGSLRWAATFDGDAQAVAVLGSAVYVGGHFDQACRTARTGGQGVCLDGSDDRIKLAAFDTTNGTLRSWTANANGIEGVLTMATNTRLATFTAGGAFTAINGKPQQRFAQFS